MFIESINKKGKTLVLISNNVSIDALINLKCFIQLVMISGYSNFLHKKSTHLTTCTFTDNVIYTKIAE